MQGDWPCSAEIGSGCVHQGKTGLRQEIYTTLSERQIGSGDCLVGPAKKADRNIAIANVLPICCSDGGITGVLNVQRILTQLAQQRIVEFVAFEDRPSLHSTLLWLHSG